MSETRQMRWTPPRTLRAGPTCGHLRTPLPNRLSIFAGRTDRLNTVRSRSFLPCRTDVNRNPDPSKKNFLPDFENPEPVLFFRNFEKFFLPDFENPEPVLFFFEILKSFFTRFRKSRSGAFFLLFSKFRKVVKRLNSTITPLRRR